MKVLQVLGSAYRATIEEQDDPALWITQAMRGAGGEFSVLLRGNAVSYAVAGQHAGGIAFGDWQQSQPPDIGADLERLIASGIDVFAVAEDVEARALPASRLQANVEVIRRSALPDFVQRFDMIWHW